MLTVVLKKTAFNKADQVQTVARERHHAHYAK